MTQTASNFEIDKISEEKKTSIKLSYEELQELVQSKGY